MLVVRRKCYSIACGTKRLWSILRNGDSFSPLVEQYSIPRALGYSPWGMVRKTGKGRSENGSDSSDVHLKRCRRF